MDVVAGAETVDLVGRRMAAVNSSVGSTCASNVIGPEPAAPAAARSTVPSLIVMPPEKPARLRSSDEPGVLSADSAACRAIHDQRAGAGLASRIVGAGHVGNDTGNGDGLA